MLPGNLGRLALEGRYVSSRSALARHSLLAVATAALCGVLYAQFSQHLPASLQITDAKALRQGNPACALAEIPPDHIFAAASVSQGGAQSGLIFGTMQWATKTVRVHVAPGDKPITAFLSGYGVIFDFAGAVDRVQRVVAMSQFMNKMVGVAGIPADRVEIPPYRECSSFNDAVSQGKDVARAKALAMLFGRLPDRDAFQYAAVQLSLPEVSFALPTEPAATMKPARVLTPGDVVAAVPMTKPQTMPGVAGLAQLEAEGAIRKPTAEEVEKFLAGVSQQYRSKLSPDFLVRGTFDYAITREVTLPEGFASSEPKFLVLAGVPAPRAPYRGCLAQMDGFRFSGSSECIPGLHDGVRSLKQMPPPNELGACRLFELPEDVPLHAVSVYEPEQPPLRDFQAVRDAIVKGGDEKPYPIDVRIEMPGEIVLVLNTYAPAIWRVSVAPGSRVAAVLSMSYHPSRVEGLAPDTPVMTTDHNDVRKPGTAPACIGMRSGLGNGYRGGPDAAIFDRAVQARTGRSLESLRGAYALKSVVVR
jgi:hypothetical protein